VRNLIASTSKGTDGPFTARSIDIFSLTAWHRLMTDLM